MNRWFSRAHAAFIFLSLAFLAGCQSTTTPKGLVGKFKIGERAQIGPLIYNVYETEYLVGVGEGADARIPSNRFLVVHLSVVNGGGVSASESVPAFTLVDDAGATFNELDNGAGIPQWLGFSRRVRPAESVTGNIVFDVAPKHYKLRVADETDEHYGLVDLPLTYGNPMPPPDAAPNPR